MSTPRIVTLSGTVHPKAEIQSVSAADGIVRFRWVNSDECPVDSGGSEARFTPPQPNPPDVLGGPVTYPEVSDATIAAAIENPLPAAARTVFTYDQFCAHCDTRVPGFSARILAARRTSTDVDHWVNVAIARNAIHLDSPDLATAFALFVAAGLMTGAERTAILAP